MTLSEFAIELPALRDEAKARWGDKEYQKTMNRYYEAQEKGISQPRPPQFVDWELNFMQMVVSNNPVKYLKDHSGKEA